MSAFVVSEWARFCSSIDPAICRRADDGAQTATSGQVVILKHDVEVHPERALAMAAVEAAAGIRGTYYVQADLLKPTNLPILSRIRDLGHEVTYHYDVLDSAGGDFEQALNEFASNLALFERNGFTVRTVCPHGNPILERDGWTSNKDFFRADCVRERYPDLMDVVVDFGSLKDRGWTYISDVRFGWRTIGDIAWNDREQAAPDVDLSGLNEITKMIHEGRSMIISTHPHRWHRNRLAAEVHHRIFQIIRYAARELTRSERLRAWLGRYYSYARRM